LREGRAWIFLLGVALVTVGVLLHIPMYMMGRHMGFRLHGMPMEADMYWGMAAIIVGIGIAAYGLLPRNVAQQRAAAGEIVISPPEDAQLTGAHWRLMAVLTIALVIDVMKPASLGFTIPGMVDEYMVTNSVASLVCGAANVAGSDFCSTCGANLRVGRNCPSCGAAQKDFSARFCNRCGTALNGS
jgi:putative MFS transporter